MSKITKITAREILDSRGYPTIEATVWTEHGSGTASVPAGTSTGRYEANELRDGKKRYEGLGVQKAIKIIETKIAPLLQGKQCTQQREIDVLMITADGTKNKSCLGANTLLAVSLACARAAAQTRQQPLYEYLTHLPQIQSLPRPSARGCLPRPFCNVINGGKHADNHLSFQEFMIVPRKKTFAENIRITAEIYRVLGTLLHKKYSTGAKNVGAEGGFSPPQLKATAEALRFLLRAIRAAGYNGFCDIAIDAAASELYDPQHKKYQVDGRTMTSRELHDFYLKLITKYPIISLEDPFHQNDFAAFAQLTKACRIQIVTDDLTVTSPSRIEKAVKMNSANCLLLKPNQIGTLSEALDAAVLALFNHWQVMVSHRSGETTDSFIADLAVALGCGQIKAGAPSRGERVVKYNRLLEIEQEIILGK